MGEPKFLMKGFVFFLIVIFFGVFVNGQVTADAVKDNYNLQAELAKGYNRVLAGEELWFSVKILNLANDNRRDISLQYDVLDESGNVIASKSETMAIETQASFVGNLHIPTDVKAGLYVLRVNLIVGGDESDPLLSETNFRIVHGGIDPVVYYYVGFGIVALLAILVVVFKGKSVYKNLRVRMEIHNIVRKKLG